MCIVRMNFFKFYLKLLKLTKGNIMTELSQAMEVAATWLDLEGVDMIIPRPDTNEVVVVITCHPDSLKHLIPSSVQNIQVKIRYEKYHAA